MATDKTEAGSVPSPDGDMILVVDDDVRASRLERFVLEEEGFSVACAGSGEEALEMLLATAPSLVLLDIWLPKMDGFITCQKIRETSQVPIIMVTGEGRDEEKVRGLEMGADDYITKPFSTNELAARVKAVLRRINHSRSKTSAARTRPSEPDISSIELNGELNGEPNGGLNGKGGELNGELNEELNGKGGELNGELNGKGGELNGEHGERDGRDVWECKRISQRSYGQDEAPEKGVGAAAAALAGDDEPYEGSVKLVVETRGAIKNMVDFVDALREYPQFHLLRMVSNARRDGMDVWLRLREPNPLRATLLAVKGVTKVEALENVGLDPETGAATRVLKVSLD